MRKQNIEERVESRVYFEQLEDVLTITRMCVFLDTRR